MLRVVSLASASAAASATAGLVVVLERLSDYGGGGLRLGRLDRLDRLAGEPCAVTNDSGVDMVPSVVKDDVKSILRPSQDPFLWFSDH